MTGLERTMAFLRREPVDRPPFHPIIMRWASKYDNALYRDFCTVPETKCRAMLKSAEDFDIDWVTVMSDPWAEASAFGIEVEYPENDLPVDKGGHLPDASSAALLKPYKPMNNSRCRNRIEEIIKFQEICEGNYFIVGWVEGPVAEYVDLRGATAASLDFLLEPENVEKAMDVITESAMNFIQLQIKAGSHCIGIGDAFCSQIGPDLYDRFAFNRQKLLVDHVHKLGAIAKLHICGNTSIILPEMIKTGADIIDIDHLVPTMSDFASLLAPHQVFSGKADPVSVIQDGSEKKIKDTVMNDFNQAAKRCIISAGCEITPGTSEGNMYAFRNAARMIRM
jgi:uroporphyrinogen decarboxylase